jgi:mono/diheme cytochrome c family protein
MNSRTATSIGLFSVGGLVMAAVSGSPAGGQQNDKEDRQALVKRGAYLVNEVARCGDCHTPRDARGRLDMTRHLQGAQMWFRPANQVAEFEDEAPNITLAGKAGKWSEEKMVKFMTSGNSDPPMPAYRLTEDDARAVAAYLRSLAGDGREKRGAGLRKDGRGRERERERDDD